MFKRSNLDTSLDTNLGTNLDTNSVTNPVTNPVTSFDKKTKEDANQSTLLIFIHLPQSRSQNQSRHHPRGIRE